MNISTELKSHFLRLYQMAFADDNFDVLELQMLYKFAEERGLSKDQLNDILLNPSQASSIPENLDEKIELILTRDLWLTKDFEQSKNEIKQLIKEAKNKQLLLHDVIQQRELLLAYHRYLTEELSLDLHELWVDKHLKANNCG